MGEQTTGAAGNPTGTEKEYPYVEVELVRSLIGEPRRHRATAHALGLRRLRQRRIHRLTPAIAGMIRRIHHMVRVRQVSGPSQDLARQSQPEAPAKTDTQ